MRMSIMRMAIFSIAGLFALTTADYSYARSRFESPFMNTELIKRNVPDKPFHTTVGEGVFRDLIVVKFAEGTNVRLRDSQLISLKGLNLVELRALLSLHKVLQIGRRFSAPEDKLESERKMTQEVSGQELGDLNLHYVLRIDPTITDQELLIDALNALDAVEIAYPQPILSPMVPGIPADIIPDLTPPFISGQGYLQPSPQGIGAQLFWQQYNVRGEGVKVVHAEGGWNFGHEDLELYETGLNKDLLGGTNSTNPSWLNHGTAVIGEIIGYDNTYPQTGVTDYGVTGIASKVDIGMVSFNGLPSRPFIEWPNPENLPDAINIAVSNAGPGDIILITSGSGGPIGNLTCNPSVCGNCSQFGQIAAEYWIDNYDVIKTATADGKIVVTSAGNGQMDLDSSNYGNRFNLTFRDSGAILVGAGTSTAPHSPICWSNYGSRVDMQGWGESVTTTGCDPNFPCSFTFGSDHSQDYTDSFSGTSSAAPIVAGAAALIQSYYKNTLGWTYGLSPYTMRKLLTETGTPQAGTNHIGPLPNLQAALTTVLAPPIPDIKANNSDGPINVSSSTPVNITATLSTGYFEQTNADVWVVAYVTDLTTSWTGWFYLGPAGEWKYYDPLFPNVEPVLQTSLVNLSPTTILNSTLPPGYTYTFYFGVDLSMNKPQGLIDTPLYLDSVAVTVPALTTRQAQWIILPIAPEKIGVFRNGVWVLDKNGNDAWDGAPPDLYYTFVLSTDKPIAGDWNGDGKTEIGVFRSTTWLLDNNGNGVWESGTDSTYTFGLASDIPVSGDWTGSGVTKIGTFRSGLWALDMNGNGVWEPGTDRSFTFGLTTDVPVTGDWNGDGKTEVGVFRDVTGSGYWYLDLNGNNVWEGCSIDGCYHFGIGTDLPVPGDWNGDGITDLGTLRAGTWLLDLNGSRVWDGYTIDGSYTFGLSGDKPVAGGW